MDWGSVVFKDSRDSVVRRLMYFEVVASIDEDDDGRRGRDVVVVGEALLLVFLSRYGASSSNSGSVIVCGNCERFTVSQRRPCQEKWNLGSHQA